MARRKQEWAGQGDYYIPLNLFLIMSVIRKKGLSREKALIRSARAMAYNILRLQNKRRLGAQDPARIENLSRRAMQRYLKNKSAGDKKIIHQAMRDYAVPIGLRDKAKAELEKDWQLFQQRQSHTQVIRDRLHRHIVSPAESLEYVSFLAENIHWLARLARRCREYRLSTADTSEQARIRDFEHRLRGQLDMQVHALELLAHP